MPAPSRFPLALATLLLSGAVHAGLPADVITVGPEGLANDCSAATIQEAIAIANADPSRRRIWVRGSFAESEVINPGSAIVIDTNLDLEITGGFPRVDSGLACSARAPTGRTDYSGLGGPEDPVFRISGSGTVTLKNLDISRGDADGDEGGGIHYRGSGALVVVNSVIALNEARGTGGGGGIAFLSNGGEADLALVQTQVLQNQAHYGGGVLVLGTGRLTVNGSTINENVARTSGGGVYVKGEGGSVNVYLEQGVALSGNTALDAVAGQNHGDGGGMFLANAALEWSGADGEMWLNTAVDMGGGLYLTDGASADIFTRGRLNPPSGQYHAAIYANTAKRGGGIATVATQDDRHVVLLLSSHDGETSQIIAGNRATERGGAIYAKAFRPTLDAGGFARAVACLRDVRMSANSAPRGAAYYSERDVTAVNRSVSNRLYFVSTFSGGGCPVTGGGSANPRTCASTGAQSRNCNLVDSNVSNPGRIFEIEGTSEEAAYVVIDRTRFYANQAQQLVYASDGAGLRITRSILDQNQVTGHLIQITEANDLRIDHNTIADNIIGEPTMMRGDSVDGDDFSFTHNIVAQPDRQTLLINGSAQPSIGVVRNNLSNDANLNVIDRSNLTGAPIFNHGLGAYSLHPSSPGVDYFASTEQPPRDFNFKVGVDLPTVPNAPGAVHDIGARELQSAGGPDALFLNGFE